MNSSTLSYYYRVVPLSRLSHAVISHWPGRVPDKADLDSMTRPDLWEKYDTHDNDESISKYLHHCTEQRVERRPPWQVNAMYDELRPIIEKFESLLPEYKPATELLTRTRGVSTWMDFRQPASEHSIPACSPISESGASPRRFLL
jgi:hypothetical protein